MNSTTNFLSRLSKLFTNRYRITLIILIGIIALGGLSYNQFLQREGFPAVQFPIGIMSVRYQVDSVDQLNSDVITPIEDALSDIEDIIEINSVVSENRANVTIQFTSDINADEGIDRVQSEISSLEIPPEAQIELNSINPASFDGENDLLLTLYNSENFDYESILDNANDLSEFLEGLNVVDEVNVKSQFSEIKNPQTQEIENIRTAYNKVGIRENDEINFYNSLQIGITKNTDIDAIELSEQVRESVDNYLGTEDGLENLNIVYSGDQAEIVNSQIGSLESNAVTGFVVILFVLFFFLNWRASIVTGIFMPIVLLAVFTFMYMFGITLNTISLFGLILVLGLFVDDAIVIVEAIYTERKNGVKGIGSIQEAIKKVSIADISGTITTILVFVPMLTISGILGEFIIDIPLTVILSLTLSIIIALTIIPFFANILIRNKTVENKNFLYYIFNGFSILIEKASIKLSQLIEFYLKRPIRIIASVIISFLVLIVVTGAFARNLEFNIFPPAKDSNEMSVSINYSENTEIDRSQEIANEVNNLIKESEYSSEFDSISYFSGDTRTADIYIDLTDMNSRSVSSPEIAEKLNLSFSSIEGADVEANVIANGPPEGQYAYTVRVFSDEQEVLNNVSGDFVETLSGKTIETPNRNSFEITNVDTNNLNNVAKVDGDRYIQIGININQDEVSSATQIAIEEYIQDNYDEEKLTSLGLTGETSISLNPGLDNQNQESFESAGLILIVALLMIYVLLVVQFGSLSQPFIVLLALPFSLWGVVPGLVITDNSLSFFVMIGFISLAGIAVNNSIMLIDYANQELEKGKSISDSITQAVKLRFRPILITTVTTIASLLPLAISDPFWEPIAYTIIFGLLATTTSILFALPAYFSIVENIRKIKNKKLQFLK